ncbi:MAG: MerR family transcriptional regulator [Silicimonas sp.]|nr:MerR family transcriptional regulator [Silicimonas sp.]
MEKSREAFRTISEVAEWLDVPTHVLRFWESRFSQIKPVKRAGGRRYYRPSDMRVIGGVKTLLHDQGMTIRGVQKLFREQGIRHVSTFSPHLFGHDAEALDDQVIEHEPQPAEPEPIQPSPAARSTRDAEPAPLADEPAPAEDAAAPAAEPEGVVFIHRRRTPDTPDAPSEPAAEPEPQAAPEPAAEEPEPPRPAIPPTPDVPTSDPADDDPSRPLTPGIAARVVLARRRDLRASQDTLALAVQRLKDIRDRLG